MWHCVLLSPRQAAPAAIPGSGGCSRKGSGQGDTQQSQGPQADSHAQEARGEQADCHTSAPPFLEYNGKSALIYCELI